jgi:hypothetical protein
VKIFRGTVTICRVVPYGSSAISCAFLIAMAGSRCCRAETRVTRRLRILLILRDQAHSGYLPGVRKSS